MRGGSLDVQMEAVRLAEQQYEGNRRLAEQGVLAPVDVVAAQTQVASFQQNAFLAQQALTAAENNLKARMLPSRDDLLWNNELVPETRAEDRRDPAGAGRGRAGRRSFPAANWRKTRWRSTSTGWMRG